VDSWVKGKKRDEVFLVCTVKPCKRSRGIPPHIFNVGTRWK